MKAKGERKGRKARPAPALPMKGRAPGRGGGGGGGTEGGNG